MSRAPASKRPGERPPQSKSGYWEQAQLPYASLLFILPLLLVHEIGVRYFAAGGMVEHRVAAFSLMIRFFNWCGAYNHHLPAMAVVAILIAWHVARHDPWSVKPSHLALMTLESVLLAIPLVGVFLLFSNPSATYAPSGDPKLLACIYLGAGIYEELVFRLGVFAILWFFLIDLCAFRQVVVVPGIVVTGALLFSAYHTLGTASFPWQAFVFITLRGLYYGVLFLGRGFGITVGVHVAYDLMYLGLAMWASK
jgi:hypothetical protein